MTKAYSHIFNEEYIEKLDKQSPLGIVNISSIVNSIEFLISNKAKHITGQTLVVDGGSSLWIEVFKFIICLKSFINDYEFLI